MGVQDLMKVIKNNASNAIYMTDLSSFKNKKVAIDTSIWAYRKFREYLPCYIRESEDEEDEEFWVVNWEPLRKRWLGAMLEIAASLLKEGVIPIFIMEDKSSSIKLDEQEKREMEKKRLEEIYMKNKEEFNNMTGRFERNNKLEKYKMSFANQVRFNFKFNKDFEKALQALNIPVYYCIEESDFLIAALAKEGIIEATLSSDTDLIIYGVPYVITHLYGNNIQIVDYRELIDSLEYTRDQLIDLAILLGTDYNKRIRGIGPVKSVNLLNQYKKLELIPSKFYTSGSRREVVRNRFKNIPSFESLIRLKEGQTIDFEIDCQEIIKNGSERLNFLNLSEKWIKITS